jgi:hypothetical protein
MLKCTHYKIKQKDNDMSLFHHVSFAAVDPLGGGLDEEIAKEQQEPEAMTLDDVSESELTRYWESVESDIEKDPEWFHFSEDE